MSTIKNKIISFKYSPRTFKPGYNILEWTNIIRLPFVNLNSILKFIQNLDDDNSLLLLENYLFEGQYAEIMDSVRLQVQEFPRLYRRIQGTLVRGCQGLLI